MSEAITGVFVQMARERWFFNNDFDFDKSKQKMKSLVQWLCNSEVGNCLIMSIAGYENIYVADVYLDLTHD